MLYRFCLKIHGSALRDCRAGWSFDLPPANQNGGGAAGYSKPENSSQINIQLSFQLKESPEDFLSYHKRLNRS